MSKQNKTTSKAVTTTKAVKADTKSKAVATFNKKDFLASCVKSNTPAWLASLFVKSYTMQGGCKPLSSGQAVNNCNRLHLAGITDKIQLNSITGKGYNKQAIAQILFYVCKAQSTAIKSKAVLATLASFGVYFGTSGLLVKQAINGIIPLYLDKAGIKQCDGNKWCTSLLKQAQNDGLFVSKVINTYAKASGQKANAILTALQAHTAKQASIASNDKALLKGAFASVKIA